MKQKFPPHTSPFQAIMKQPPAQPENGKPRLLTAEEHVKELSRPPVFDPAKYNVFWETAAGGSIVLLFKRDTVEEARAALEAIGEQGRWIIHPDGSKELKDGTVLSVKEQEDETAAAPPPRDSDRGKPRCQLAAPGWFCTRIAGHDGPCAAHKTPARPEEPPHGWNVTTGEFRPPGAPPDWTAEVAPEPSLPIMDRPTIKLPPDDPDRGAIAAFKCPMSSAMLLTALDTLSTEHGPLNVRIQGEWLVLEQPEA